MSFKFLGALSLSLSLLISSCTDSSQNRAGNNASDGSSVALSLDYLVGDWKVTTMNNYESWEKIGTDHYQGKSYSITKGDTSIMETIEIKRIGNQLNYIPIVYNQNQGQPVYFSQNMNAKNGFLFDNPKHDSPKSIGYYPMNQNQMTVSISGTANIDLVMVRR